MVTNGEGTPRPLRFAVTSMYNGHVNRGMESWADQFCRHLADLGHECILIQGGARMESDAPFRTVSVHYERPDRSGQRTQSPLAGQLRRYALYRHVMALCEQFDRRGREHLAFAARTIVPLARFRPDVIIPMNGVWPIIAAQVYRATARRARIVLVGQNAYDDTMRVAPLLGVHGMVALTPDVLEEIKAHSKVPCALIPNGVDVRGFHETPAAHVDLERPIVLVTSALTPYKRVELAIEAVARTNMSLLVLGDGPLRQRLCDRGSRLLGPGRFLHLPSVPFAEVASYYRAADVFTLPSESLEAFASVIVEAMAAGLPVVVNDDPRRKWIVGDYGETVDPADIQCYAGALSRAASRGKAGTIPDSVNRFDWPALARRWADFCRGILPAEVMAGRGERGATGADGQR